MTTRPTTIAEAVAALGAVVDWAEEVGSPIGYFPALHREVALSIGSHVDDGFFDDGPRMVRMVGEFTYRYLDALDRYRDGGRPTPCWAFTFEESRDDSLTILQQILLAMVCHIGLDLGVVSATVASGDELPTLRDDFEKMNVVLAGLVNMDRVAAEGVSPRLRDVDLLGRVTDGLIADAIRDARQHAWDLAVTLAPLRGTDRDDAIEDAAARVTAQARRVAHPDFVIRELLRDVVRPAEDRDVPAVIARLCTRPKGRARAPRPRDHVVVLGGGVGGLSAAHELAQRGYKVTVLEDRAVPGGKARSVAGPLLKGQNPLPGEHGFRFFPGFYRHLPDTMARIPFGDQPDGVVGNLVRCPRFEFAREHQRSLVLPVHPPQSVDDVKLLLQSLVHGGWDIPATELAYFVSRMLLLLSSCKQRRYDEWENMGWLDFVGAKGRSEGYRRYLADGLTRTFVAAKADLMSARTGGYIFLQLVFDMGRRAGDADRVLDGPTNERWIQPWVDHVASLGVDYRLSHRVKAISSTGSRITGATVRDPDGNDIEVTGDWYVSAVPVERMRALADEPLRTADPQLAELDNLKVRQMNGVQFYLRDDVEVVNGHTVYIDSPWALTSISQAQFWRDVDIDQMGDGTVRGVLSVDVSDWETVGYNGKKACECTHDEIIQEVWDQLKRHLDTDAAQVLERKYRAAHIDSDIRWPTPDKQQDVDSEPLLINTKGSWRSRPEAVTAIDNLFLASDYVRTFTDLACMEAANEAARRAVNGILDATGSREDRCEIWNLHEPMLFAPWRALDEVCWKLGHPHRLSTDLSPS
jgi:uncharacterized protein with NAD-binding domain and iron-sulfur cluster